MCCLGIRQNNGSRLAVFPYRGETIHRVGYTADFAILARQLLEAVSILHDDGFAHRDLWDASQGMIRLIDFELATRLNVIPAYYGTPGYIAPELVEKAGGGTSELADTYSCVAVLAMMLTKTDPFWRPLIQSMAHPDPSERMTVRHAYRYLLSKQ